MKIKGIIDEDFINYKFPSMFLISSTCDWKCCKEAGIDIKVNPINAKDYKGAKALRPLNSMLSKVSLDQAGITRLPSVEEATHNYIKILKK